MVVTLSNKELESKIDDAIKKKFRNYKKYNIPSRRYIIQKHSSRKFRLRRIWFPKKIVKKNKITNIIYKKI